jgi:hypothetical protein
MPTANSPRRKLHHAIRNEFTEDITKFAIDHRTDIDEGSVRAAICSRLRLMERILAAVDRELDPDGLVSTPQPTKLI